MKAHCAPLNIFGLGEVRVPTLFRNNFHGSDLPYSKGFMKDAKNPPKNARFWKLLFVKEVFDPVRKGAPL